MNEISGESPLISKNIIHGLEEFNNIDDIQRLIEATLDNMSIEEKRLTAAFPLNPL